MTTHLVVGAGTIGTAVALQLAGRGDDVVLTSRRGRAPRHEHIRAVALDATDHAALASAAEGASTLFDCTNPAYDRWSTDFPPLATSALAAAERSGAVLVILSNLYAYGAVDGPMGPDTPQASTLPKALVRARIWQDALAAHRAGRVRAVEVRAADFVGPGAESPLGERVVPRLLDGKGVKVLGDPDVERSWSYTEDVARTLVACADQPDAWGRPWHAVVDAPRSQRQAVDDLAAAAGVDPVRVSSLPTAAVRLAGLFDRTIREVPKVLYQFQRPFVSDDSLTREALGLSPTPWSEVTRAVVASFRTPQPATA